MNTLLGSLAGQPPSYSSVAAHSPESDAVLFDTLKVENGKIIVTNMDYACRTSYSNLDFDGTKRGADLKTDAADNTWQATATVLGQWTAIAASTMADKLHHGAQYVHGLSQQHLYPTAAREPVSRTPPSPPHEGRTASLQRCLHLHRRVMASAPSRPYGSLHADRYDPSGAPSPAASFCDDRDDCSQSSESSSVKHVRFRLGDREVSGRGIDPDFHLKKKHSFGGGRDVGLGDLFGDIVERFTAPKPHHIDKAKWQA